MVCLTRHMKNISNCICDTYIFLLVFCFFYCSIKVWKTFDICGKHTHTLVFKYLHSTQIHTFFHWHIIFNLHGKEFQIIIKVKTIMKIIKANSILKQLGWILILLVAGTFISCNKTNKKNKTNSELTEEIQDVKQEMGEIMQKEKEELRYHVDSIVENFNTEIYTYEREIQKGTKQINAETQEIISELKAKSQELDTRVKEIQEQNEKSWEEFKDELEHDTNQFTESIEDFFNDNK